MSQAEELLNSLGAEHISTLTVDPVTEPHIVIGADRFITVPKELQRIAVQYDHDVETVTFDCPRYWDGLDMSQMRIYINFMRPDKYRDCYTADNIHIDEADDTIMHFDWTISRNVTLKDGPIVFLVCIKKADAEDNEINHWNSELNTQMYISEGLEVANESMMASDYPDYLASLEREYGESVEKITADLLASAEAGEFDGYSPTVATASISGGTRVSVTDRDGTKSFDVMNGADGISPNVTLVNIEGGTRVVLTDYQGANTFDIMNGKDGVSPNVTLVKIDGGTRVVLTDYQGANTFDIMDGIDGIDGTDGVSPTVVISQISGGHQVAITDATDTKTFDVMDGVDGQNGTDGTDGIDGISPTISVASINGGHRITITDATGTKSFDVMDGTQDISDAVVDYMNNFVYIGDVEPAAGPILWFDTSGAT